MNEQRTTLEQEYAIPGLTFSARAVSLPNALYGVLQTETLTLEVFGHSQAGRSEKRLANQDYFYMPIQQPESISSGSFMFAVADGVGGADHSERASEMAIKEILRHYYAFSRYGVNHLAAFTQAAQQAHHIVKREGVQKQQTMATTLVATMLPTQTNGPLTLDFACIGDSRAYILRPGQGLMEQVTQDSLWYQDEQQRGGEAAQQADALVKANPRLVQSPRTIGGVGADLQVDYFENIPVQTGDLIVICTDGVYKPLGDVQGIQPILQQNMSDLNAAATLVFNAVRRQGGMDDATLILIKVVKAGSTTPAQKPIPAPVAVPPPTDPPNAPGETSAATSTPVPASAGRSNGGRVNSRLIMMIVIGLLLVGAVAAIFMFGRAVNDSPPASATLVAREDSAPAAGSDETGTTAEETGGDQLDAYPTNTPAPGQDATPADTDTATATATPTPQPPTATPAQPETESPAEAATATASPPTAEPAPEATPTDAPTVQTEPATDDGADSNEADENEAATEPETAPQEPTPPPPDTTPPQPTVGDCTPGNCKYPAPPQPGKPAPGAIHDNPNPLEFAWGYQGLAPDEYVDIRIYDSPEAAAPVIAYQVRDRNFVSIPLQLGCQDYYWTIRIASAGNIKPHPAIEGLSVVETVDYTGSRSPESERRQLSWQANCP
jgi:serine/threonine protein phosphatase PrpC